MFFFFFSPLCFERVKSDGMPVMRLGSNIVQKKFAQGRRKSLKSQNLLTFIFYFIRAEWNLP